jgi:hypothetical protein
MLTTPYYAPRANAICERFLLSVRRECLDHLLILHEKQLHRVLGAYVRYFNRARPHQGIKQQRPEPEAGPTPPDRQGGKVLSLPILGGLHHDYCNGIVAKDKFCLSRMARLRLSWSPQPIPRESREPGSVGYPSSKEQSPCREETHAPETTSMDGSASMHCQTGGMESVGSGLSSAVHLDQHLPSADQHRGGDQ